MIGIVDYGMGNLRSVQKAFEKVGANVFISSDLSLFDKAGALVFPGQGSFPDAIHNLTKQKFIEPLKEWVRSNKPFLGICLGLQLLFEKSEEGGIAEGLCSFKGNVVKFSPRGKIPHMGWNTINLTDNGKKCPLFKNIPGNTFFYFVHSFYIVPEDKSIVAATTQYIDKFASVIWRGNIYAMQFHPEKSQDKGLSIIKSFCDMFS